MPTWPSSNKASTDSIDQGTDNPNTSRAQIKKDIDNINTIIDTFDFTNVANGDALIYNNTGSKFGTSATPQYEAWLLETGRTTIEGGPVSGKRRVIFEEFDPNNIVSLGSDSERFILTPGRYMIEVQSKHGPITQYAEEYGKPNILIYPIVDAATDNKPYRKYYMKYQDISTDTEYEIHEDFGGVVLPGNVSVGSGPFGKVQVKITKF